MIIVTNDDGVHSPGIAALAKSLSKVAAVKVVAPKGAQSSSGMSITFHRPLTMTTVSLEGSEAVALTGTPADCVFVAVHRLFKGKRIEMIASGINLGENISMQSFFSSGTVSAAMSGAIMGIRSVAFSKVVPGQAEQLEEEDFVPAAEWAARIVSFLMSRGFPPGVDLLNVNFPLKVTGSTKAQVTSMARQEFRNYVLRRTDPRGNRYFWLAGDRLEPAERGTDAYATLVEGKISITPISLSSLQRVPEEDVLRHLSEIAEPSG